MALLGRGIGEGLLMARLGHLGSLKLKQKSNWNWVEIETAWKWKCDLKKTLETKLLIYLRPASTMALVDVSLWSASAT